MAIGLTFLNKCHEFIKTSRYSIELASAHKLSTQLPVSGSHPFDRLDLLVLPACFSGLGFASPSLTFLSQSVFCGEDDFSPMCRISHEISHSWFGLVVGAMDWTEEWLSEVSWDSRGPFCHLSTASVMLLTSCRVLSRSLNLTAHIISKLRTLNKQTVTSAKLPYC